MTQTQGAVALIWIWMAIISGGYARTRGRGAWTWFVWTLVFGPFAALLLVTWPTVEKAESPAEQRSRG